MKTTAPNPLTAELVTFVQHQLPGLEDGQYQLIVSQYVLDLNQKKVNDDDLTSTYTFAVEGDRFALSSPGTTVLSVFPPAGAVGEFSSVLPHVVLGEASLPWSRYPTNTLPYTKPQPGLDVETDVPTWLAVLVLDADDVAAFPGLTLEPVAATVGDLFPKAVLNTSTLGNNYSYFWKETSITGLDPNQTIADQIRVLDVPLELFWQIAPTVNDLSLTAHTREVSTLNKSSNQGIPLAGDATPLGTTSIVFATRLPAAPTVPPQGDTAASGRTSYAYLVSLEQLQDFLPVAESGGVPPTPGINPALSLRLAVLTSWNFSTTGSPAGFVNALLALNGRPSGSATDAANTTLRLNYAGSNATVKAALDMGFVPLNETLRDAGQTVSWYRGPLTPFQNMTPAPLLPITSSDKATLLDPTTGMFDSSYAAAWSLGRQLALQDTAFATALYRWKADQTAAVVNAVEAEFLSEAFTPDNNPSSFTASGGPDSRPRFLQREAMLALRKTLSPAGSQTAPTPP